MRAVNASSATLARALERPIGSSRTGSTACPIQFGSAPTARRGPRRRRRHRRRRLHGPLDRLLPREGGPRDPDGRARARDRGLRGVGPQRRLVLGDVRDLSRESSSAPTAARPRRRCERPSSSTVDEVGAVTADEGIDCHYRKGGTVMLARNAAQLQRARQEVEEARSLGVGDADLRLLSASEARELVGATQVLGATYTPHCASIIRLAWCGAWPRSSSDCGVRICERTPVLEIHPGRVVTTHGTVRARRRRESNRGIQRSASRGAPGRDPLLLADDRDRADRIRGTLEEIGLRNGETFNDLRHLVIYGQRTHDGRIAFGGRGAPYHYGSRIEPVFDRDRRMHALIQETLVELFPALVGTRITHRWGGPLGIARDWHPSVGFDRATGLGWAGGYVGDGVAVTNLAGRTLAALVAGVENDCTRLCWVGHRSRPWEPEPLRWIGVNAALTGDGSGRPRRAADGAAVAPRGCNERSARRVGPRSERPDSLLEDREPFVQQVVGDDERRDDAHDVVVGARPQQDDSLRMARRENRRGRGRRRAPSSAGRSRTRARPSPR